MYIPDLDAFWSDDLEAHMDNCFNPKAAQVALGIRMSNECVFAELGEEGNPWGDLPREKRIELNKRYNDIAEKTVGRRLLAESMTPADAVLPPIKRIGEVFGGSYVHNGISEWLHPSASTPAELEKVLDGVEKLNMRECILPDNWDDEKARIYETYGLKPRQLRGVRGPVTLAMSLYGDTNLIYLFYDAPQLFKRFSQVITKVIIDMGCIMDTEAGYQKGEEPGGFGFADDNCVLLNPEMYEAFGYPVLRDVFNKFSPNEGDNRSQHSDSSMTHLLPIIGRVNLTSCNFGPDVYVEAIREYMPKTRIDGVLAPFTFMGNDDEKIITEVKRDCDAIRTTGTRGLNLSTAGSINNGSLLTSMRTVMWAIQEFGQY